MIEVDERYDSNGTELVGINERKVHDDLKTIFDFGIMSVAISFIHGYKYQNIPIQRKSEGLINKARYYGTL